MSSRRSKPDEGDDAPAVQVGRTLEASGPPDLLMEELLEKLKILDYEKSFCRKKKPFRKPLTSTYFAIPTNNPGEQYNYFCSLAVWLLSLVGIDTPAPKQTDDPNQFLSDLVRSVKSLGFASLSYHPSKLTQGYGAEVCGLLDGLVQMAMEKNQIRLKRPAYPQDEQAQEEELEDEGEAEGMVEDMDRGDDDEVEEEEAYMGPGLATIPGTAAAAEAEDKQILASNIDPNIWKMELERVAPKLRITLAADCKDWRSHMEHTHSHNKVIGELWPDSRSQLERLAADLDGSLEKVATRERFLNDSFDELMSQYRAARENLMQLQERYNNAAESVSERNTDLARINEQIDEIKSIMDERGSNISDTAPVVRIKAAIKKLGEEMHAMEVRLGVVSHTLLQLSIKDKTRMHAAAVLSDDEYD